MIQVRVLGPLEADIDGVPADLGGPRQRCVLARLIAEHGRVVSVDRLIDDLYADEAPPRALAAVQSYVSHLRRALEPDRAARAPAGILITAPPGYALRLPAGEVDAWSFEEKLHQATALDDPAAVHARLSAALESWHGAPFGEFGGLPWADLEARRLDELRLTAIEARTQAALQLGRAPQTIAELSQLTAEYPLREEAWRLLALALYQSGRQGDALAALRRARARLAEDLGVDPGPALRELEEGILVQAPQLSGPPRAARAAAMAVAPPAAANRAPSAADSPALPAAAQYFGRDADLDRLTAIARQARSGQLQLALVAGDPGAGKTALADRIGERLAAEGWTVCTGRCPEHEGAPAGWPWAEIVRMLASTAPPDDPEALAGLLSDSTSHDGDAPAARFRLHRAVAAYLDTVSGATPLLVVLDDIHRADGETLATLADVTAQLTASRILVLATYRPAEASEQLSGCLATLAAREPVRVTLRGLDADAAAELIQATCTRPVDPETARTVVERTGGNPFFLRETIRLLDSEGTLAATTEVPAGVRDVLQRRIARLPATAQTILQQAAVLGTEADIDVLADMAGADENILLDAIEAGLFTSLVTEPGPGRVRFSHALVRDTLYQSLSRLRRSRLHARAASAIERHSPGEVAALSYHFTEAGTEPGKAARYCELAAEQAEQRFAYHEAARLWEQAIACLDKARDVPEQERLELVLGLVRALAHTGRLASARSYRQDAVRAALPLDDPVLLARVIVSFDVPRLWYSHEYGVIDHEIVDMVEQTLDRLSPGDQQLRCRLLSTLGFELQGAKSDRGYQASTEAVEIARRLGDAGALTIAINARYFQTYRNDGLAERRSLGAELTALRGKPVIADALAHVFLLVASSGAADFTAADRHADEATHIADRYGLHTIAAAVIPYRAMRTALDGEPNAAAELYDQAGAAINQLGLWQHGFGTSIFGRFSLLVMLDRVAEMAEELEPFGAVETLRETYALALACSGRVADARTAAGPPLPIGRDILWLFMTGVRGLLAIAIDDHDRGESAYQALLPYAARPMGADCGLFTLWPAAQVLGDLAHYLGLPGADEHYRHALAVADQAGVGLWRDAALRRLG